MAELGRTAVNDDPSEEDWQASLQANLQRNQVHAMPGPHQTPLSPAEEKGFLAWVDHNMVPFNPKAPLQDYDMRGFYRGLQRGDPDALTAVNPNDQRLHFPDKWKTPAHETFSNESKYAKPTAPRWKGDQLIDHNGKVLFDDAAPKKGP